MLNCMRFALKCLISYKELDCNFLWNEKNGFEFLFYKHFKSIFIDSSPNTIFFKHPSVAPGFNPADEEQGSSRQRRLDPVQPDPLHQDVGRGQGGGHD